MGGEVRGVAAPHPSHNSPCWNSRPGYFPGRMTRRVLAVFALAAFAGAVRAQGQATTGTATVGDLPPAIIKTECVDTRKKAP